MIVRGVDPEGVVAFVARSWERLGNEMVARYSVMDECRLAYESKFGQTWEELKNFRSRRYLPLSRTAVETNTGRRLQGCMPTDAWFSFEGRTPDDVEAAKRITALTRYQLHRTEFREEFAKVLKQASIYGFSPYAVVWSSDQKDVPDDMAYASALGDFAGALSQGTPADLPDPATTTIRDYDGPRLVCGSVWDYRQDRWNRGDSYPLRMTRFFKSKAHLLEWARRDDLGVAIYENVEGLHETNTETELTDALNRSADAQRGFSDNPPDGVELIEAWGDFYVSDGESKRLIRNHVAVIANKTTLIRFEPNPYAHGKSPWSMFVLKPDPGNTYGTGDLEPVLGLQDAANVRFNQVIEANALTINPVSIVRSSGTVDTANLINAPGAAWMVGPNDSIEPLHQINNTALGFNELAFIKAEFVEAAGSMNSVSMPGVVRSATEAQAISSAAEAPVAAMLKHIESAFLVPVLASWAQLNQQLMDEQTWIRVTDPQMYLPALDDFGQPKPVPMWEQPRQVPLKIAHNDIAGAFDVVPVGGTFAINRQQAASSLIQAVQVFGATPAAERINFGKLFEWFMERQGVDNAWMFLKTEAEVFYDRQQAAMAQMSPGGQGGVPPGGPGGPEDGQGQGGPQDLPGLQGGPRPPANPGGQPSVGGPQTSG